MKTTDDSVCALRKSKPKTSNPYINLCKMQRLNIYRSTYRESKPNGSNRRKTNHPDQSNIS